MMAGEGFKALADPTRRRILELLRAGDMTAGELAEHFDLVGWFMGFADDPEDRQ